MVLNAFTLRVSRIRREIIVELMKQLQAKQLSVINKKLVIEILETNLKTFVKQEDYESAIKCRDALKTLYNNKN